MEKLKETAPAPADELQAHIARAMAAMQIQGDAQAAARSVLHGSSNYCYYATDENTSETVLSALRAAFYEECPADDPVAIVSMHGAKGIKRWRQPAAINKLLREKEAREFEASRGKSLANFTPG